MVSLNLYDSPEEAAQREELLGILDQLVKQWIQGVARNYGFGESICLEANAKIFTFGSNRLGVHSPGMSC